MWRSRAVSQKGCRDAKDSGWRDPRPSGNLRLFLRFHPLTLRGREGRYRQARMNYLFDKCVLDSQRRELRRDRRVVPIEPQIFDLLHYCCATGIVWSVGTSSSPKSGRDGSSQNRP